jgi:uncharacterized membrane protein YcaP (DUF421 family)
MFDLPPLPDALARGLLLSAAAVLWTLLLARLVGLRAFSKMTAFDFVATVAIGSLIAQAGTTDEIGQFVQSLAAIAGVFGVQWALARARLASDAAAAALRNDPVLLAEHGHLIPEAMRRTRVSEANVMEKLRSADVAGLEQVRAVVLETTGDISVLTGDVDPRLLEGVRRIGA